jgi:hypothetical protein
VKLHKLFAAASTAAALVTLAFAPLSHAEPGADPAPPCLAEGTCALLSPDTESRYLPLAPTSNGQQAPLAPAGTAP